jgi:hypothetical protein
MEMCLMRSIVIALGLGTALASTATAQMSWVGSIQGGYSVSTATAASFPAGGSFGSSAFIGRQLSPLFTLGVEGGFFGVENTTTVSRIDCPPASVPGSLGCDQTAQAELDWIQLGATGRVGKNDGRWRPYGALGLGIYFGVRDTEVSVVNANTGTPIGIPLSQSINRTAVGGSVGGGLDWTPEKSSWSVGVAARLHYLVGGDENGEFGGDTFVTLLAGVGYRW